MISPPLIMLRRCARVAARPRGVLCLPPRPRGAGGAIVHGLRQLVGVSPRGAVARVGVGCMSRDR